MKTNEMTPQESLGIISDAIKNSRRRIEMNSALPLMLWGISVPLIALVVWYLWSHTGMPQWNYLWFVLTPLIALVQHFTIDRKLEKSKGFINDVLGYIWLTFGVFAVTIAVLGLFRFVPDITLTILIMMGFAATVSGLVVKNGCSTYIAAARSLFQIQKPLTVREYGI